MSTEPYKEAFAHWVILELMGHRRLAGYLTEQEIAGHAFLRLDIPSAEPGKAWKATQFYNGTSVYGITPVDEDTARAVAHNADHMPVQRWELAQFARQLPQGQDVEDVEGDEDGDGYDEDDDEDRRPWTNQDEAREERLDL